ncbi:hypothetical protein PAERUG_P64_East_of_England_6_01_14_01957 [Pseudomonas aeruginosa]|nr:hypothetical protein PAERUG_P64_East_of_England_6_01_14_01957 [Pseudomonas aeruginosa]
MVFWSALAVWLLLLWLSFTSSAGAGKVRTVPSLNTNVRLRICPRTQESVQSPEAVPLATAPATPGSSMPLAVRLSGPMRILNG